MKTRISIYVLFITTLITIGCNTNKNMTSGANLTSAIISDTTWELTKLEGTRVDQSTTTGKKIHFTLNSAENRVNGYAGCNTFYGSYTLEKGNRIRFSKLVSTRMACLDAAIDESNLLEIFNLADNYTINGDTLMLNIGRRAPLAVFKKVITEDQIVEKYWKLKTLDGQDIKMAENQEREVHFVLKTNENSVVGYAGCNTINGTYTLEEGHRIRFSNMATTMRACPDVDVNEAAFLKVFELTDNYTIKGDRLMLYVGRRAPLAIFEAVYFN